MITHRECFYSRKKYCEMRDNGKLCNSQKFFDLHANLSQKFGIERKKKKKKYPVTIVSKKVGCRHTFLVNLNGKRRAYTRSCLSKRTAYVIAPPCS